MPERDRIERLEYQLATVARQIAGMPVRIAHSSSGEKFRLIRGQSYGIQSGTNILLDNIVVLAGGLDPSAGDTAAQVSVYNLFGATFADNEWVDAVYSEGATASSDWETLKSTTGTEQKRLIRGQTTANVLAGATTFSIDHIELLSGSIDPRSTPGSSSETLTIHKEDVKAALRDNDWITAIYNDTDGQWECLCTERFRAIRGTWYSGTSTLVVDHIVVLDSGLDPRSDTTSNTETINVTNVAGDTYGSGDKVYADWNAKDGVWESRPKAGRGNDGASGLFVCVLDADIDKATPGATEAGTGTVYRIDQGGGLTSLGTRAIFNPFTCKMPASSAQYACSKTYQHDASPGSSETESDDEFMLTGPDMMRVLWSLTGAGAATSLAIPEDGTTADDIQWMGGTCEGA